MRCSASNTRDNMQCHVHMVPGAKAVTQAHTRGQFSVWVNVIGGKSQKAGNP